MNIGRIMPAILLLVMIPSYFSTLTALTSMNKRLPKDEEVGVILPSPILKITSLDFDGLVADALYLKSIVFYGSTFVGKEQRKFKEREYARLYNMLKASTDLDPYFLDPYLFANAILTWDANMVCEANILLAKGSRYREWDYWLPFYLGFNEFYFLHDNAKASEYLMEGSKRPDAPSLMATLAVRLAYKVDRTEIAIVFLQETLKKTRDKDTRKELELRLATLEGVLALERAVEAYKNKSGKPPHDLKELLDKGFIAHIPADPYGGEYYIDEDGSVKTTSDLYSVRKAQQ